MNDESTFRIILATVCALELFIRAYYRRAAGESGFSFATSRESRLNVALRRPVALAGMLSLVIYVISPQWMAWSALPLPAWLRWIGAGLGILALLLLFWVHRALGKNWSRTVRLKADHTLVTSGPYRWVRHPMYTTLYVMSIAYFFLSANWFIGLTWIAMLTSVVASRVGKEEAMLIETFGDEYRAYIRHTGRFLPRLVR
jgi:protein-S-isoprenylcysteine O-methyltransferase Ste14